MYIGTCPSCAKRGPRDPLVPLSGYFGLFGEIDFGVKEERSGIQTRGLDFGRRDLVLFDLLIE